MKIWLLFLTLPLSAQDLMPWPQKAERGAGELVIGADFGARVSGEGAADARLRGAVDRFIARMGSKGTGAGLAIEVERANPGVQKYGDDESYRLSVTPQGARLVAREPLGVLRGLETFLQLKGAADRVPAVEITDAPRFGWRGLSLDVSRHFLSVATVKRVIDGIAAVKMNVFHWHLSDDQGFRIESKLHPFLHQKGSDGLYYKQEQVREVIAYARDRGVRVVPEFDIPGHATSWFAGYPHLASGAGPYEIIRKYGVFPATMDPTRESTYKFLDGFIGEMARLFPDAYFHIGGDEVMHKGEWAKSPRVKAFLKSHKLADLHALQAYFNRRVLEIVTKHGKLMEGWDEILHPDLPKSIVIQSWQGQKSLADAARAGYSGILSAGYYLDLMQPASQHYAVDPLKGETAGLTPEQQKRVMGGEAAMWEELATEQNIDAKLWPRTAAIAERLWSAGDRTNVADMYRRLAKVSEWLESQGMQHRAQLRALMQKLAGKQSVAPLEKFAEVLEPIKEYERHETKRYRQMGSAEPFDRLVDAIPPESDAAREFAWAVDRFLKSRSAEDARAVRAKLVAWSENLPAVEPLLRANPLLGEHVEVAKAVGELCSIGLSALDGRRAADVERVVERVKELGKGGATDVLIVIAPAVQRLMEAR